MHRYFTKASPARSGDDIEFFAEVELLASLSFETAKTG